MIDSQTKKSQPNPAHPARVILMSQHGSQQSLSVAGGRKAGKAIHQQDISQQSLADIINMPRLIALIVPRKAGSIFDVPAGDSDGQQKNYPSHKRARDVNKAPSEGRG